MIFHIFNGGMTHISPAIILHILEYSNFTNKNGVNDHFFYIINYGKVIGKGKNIKDIYDPIFINYGIENNYKYVDSSYQMIYLLFSLNLGKSLLFLHGTIRIFGYPILFMLVLLFRSHNFLKKTSFIAWGAGDFVHSRNKYIKFLAKKIHFDFFVRIRNLITISDGDCDLAKGIYTKTNVIKLSYLRELVEYPMKKKNEELLIIVSHSGWPHNHHHHSFKLLEHLKNDNIKIICPLSYGDEKYIQTVISEGNHIFKSKFSYFTELKSRDEYSKLLNSAHVYLTNATIQTGGFAVRTSIYGGARVFLTGNLLYSFRNDGLFVSDVKEVSTLKYRSLIKINIETRDKNRIIMKTNKNIAIQKWKTLYC